LTHLPCTPAAWRALETALQLAAQAEAETVQPRHVLQAILLEPEGQATRLLADAGLSAAIIADWLSSAAQSDAPDPNVRPLPFGPGLQETLNCAATVAHDLTGERTIASDHLLVALVRGDEELRTELVKLGLDVARLEARLVALAIPILALDEPLHLAEPTERIDTARILDANANRAREALRVIEDYCRFSLDDPCLSAETKQLRHDLTQQLGTLPGNLLVEARETLRDVGTRLTTMTEHQRHSLEAVVRANLKRLAEALRSLEEYSKLHRPQVSQALEALRYRSYTLERAILIGTTARERLADARLYVLLTGSLCTGSLDWTIQEAAAGGARMVQLREKNLGDRELLDRARKVRHWTRKAGVLFIMNDRPDIARLTEADGVHVGQDELWVKDVRRILGPNALIGVSTHTIDQVRQAVRDGASYLGVGPTFPSETKEFADFPGLPFVEQAARETTLPAFVIGGVNRDTIGAAVAAGARRVAVSQAICQADDPRAAAAELLRILTTAQPVAG
jgi:thiamine-phosphate pyrophosphorylase